MSAASSASFLFSAFWPQIPRPGARLFGFTPLFGLDPATHQGDRIVGPLTGVWFMIFAMPMFLLTPDYPAKRRLGDALHEGLTELKQTLA